MYFLIPKERSHWLASIVLYLDKLKRRTWEKNRLTIADPLQARPMDLPFDLFPRSGGGLLRRWGCRQLSCGILEFFTCLVFHSAIIFLLSGEARLSNMITLFRL